MNADNELSLDFGFLDVEVEYVAPKSSDQPRRMRVVDNSLTPSRANIAAFWAKVVKSPTCWYWVGAISAPDRYGRFNFQRANRQRTMLAHRFSVELVHGPLDPSVVCKHKCNEPLCVRVGPGHLVQSTHSENVRYAIALGRLSGHALLDGQGALTLRAVPVDPRGAARRLRRRYTATREDPSRELAGHLVLMRSAIRSATGSAHWVNGQR